MKIAKVLKMKTFGLIALALGLMMSFTATPMVHAQETPGAKAVRVCNNQAPGSGYYIQRSHALTRARVYQLYNGSYNCVVTVKIPATTTPTLTWACIKVTGTDWNCNVGNFKEYAGAVWYYGEGKCVKYEGYHAGTVYQSPWGNCGL